MVDETSEKYFTVEEANRMLPLVSRIVGDIVELFVAVHERRDRLRRIRQAPGASTRDEDSPHSEELRQIEDEIDKDIRRVEGFVDELRQLNVELKDPVTGLVDFRALMDGRAVYLCWKLGEEEVAHWHEIDAGFSGRQPLLARSLAGEEESLNEEG